MRGACTSKCSDSAENKYIKFYGILKRKKHTNDIWQTPRIAK